jgi:hypothetical protein
MFLSLAQPRSVLISFERSFHRLRAIRLQVRHQQIQFFVQFLRIPLAEIRTCLALALG